jgi:hypothetical protein
MVQIIEHRAETSVDFVVEGEAASSTLQVPSRPVPGTTVVHAARQHTAAQTSRTPLRASSAGVVGGQGVVATPSKLHGLTGGHEAMAG